MEFAFGIILTVENGARTQQCKACGVVFEDALERRPVDRVIAQGVMKPGRIGGVEEGKRSESAARGSRQAQRPVAKHLDFIDEGFEIDIRIGIEKIFEV
jgi:hypothetical protein